MPRAKRGEKAAPTEEPTLSISADELTAICEVRHAILCLAYTFTQSTRPTPAWTLRWELGGGLLQLGYQAQSSGKCCCSPSRLDC